MPASQEFVYPQPTDHDDDDVVWALQAGSVEWQRGAKADALVWLRRAIESANAAGNAFRASEIQAAVDELAEIMWGGSEQPPADELVDSELDDSEFEEIDDAAAEELSDDDLVAEEAWLEEDTSETALDAPSALLDDADPETMAPSALLDDADPETMAPSALLDDVDPATIAPLPLLSASDDAEATVVGSTELLSPYDADLGDPGVDDGLVPDAQEHTVLDALPPEGIDDEALPSYELEEPAVADALPSYALEEADPGALPSYALDEPAPQHRPLPSYAPNESVVAAPRPDPARPDSVRGPSSAPRVLPAIVDLPRRSEPDLNAIVSSVPAVPIDLGVEPVDLAIATSLEESPRAHLAVKEALQAHAPVTDKPIVDGVPLNECLGFEDLPEDIQIKLALTARLERLAVDEELNAFGAALVTHGAAAVVTDISDEPALIATKGDVVFTEGSLLDGTKLRVVSTLQNTVIAVWSRTDLEEALKDCPWVAETLRAIADRFQAMAGVTLGTLGERLDAALRRSVIDRMEVRAYAPGEQLIGKDTPVPGLYIVGAGRVELLDDDDSHAVADLLPGDFVFPQGVLSAGAAPNTARAGTKGALLLVANRSVAHELVTSVPPLLEALVS
jgi:CRP-like cAMP-binding protein